MQVELSEDAEAELLAVIDWYESRQSGLGKRFASEVQRVIASIAANPLLWTQRDGGYRRVNCPVFPYFLPYVVRDDRIVVLAVAHGHRRPGYWQDRIA